jgi:pimeloyl-ACP methyl ester carboxylesterase
VILAYSWGGYLALRHAAGAARKPDAIALINPTLIAENPLSLFVRGLLSVPGLGPWLIGRTVGERARGFVEACFRPETPPDGLKDALIARLSDPGLWLGAAKYKALQQAAPLASLAEVPAQRLLVLRGERDEAVTWSTQEPILRPILKSVAVEVKTIPGAGHSLLWTHGDEVAAALLKLLGEVRGQS